MVGSGSNQAESLRSQRQDQIIFITLSEEEIGREVYVLLIPMKVNLGAKVTSLMRKMSETCKRRLIT